MVEQGTHKPLDVGSNPTLATQKPVWWTGFYFSQRENMGRLTWL